VTWLLAPNTQFSGFGEGGADHTENETACKRANHSENALIRQTPLQRMFGGFCQNTAFALILLLSKSIAFEQFCI